jgi:TrmH family RNA methyltransferase
VTITSAHNESLKEIRKLAGRRWRDKLQRFVAEGEDLLDAAQAAGWDPLVRYVAEGTDLDGVTVAPHVLAEISQLGSGTRALAVYAQRWAAAATGPHCLALWGVGDPGNVGTALRSALAFGAPSVALGPGTVDPYGHKAVRASMGALFSVPVVRVREVSELPGPRVALVAGRGRPLDEVAAEAGTLVVGAEREGLPAAVVAGCDEVAHIPIHGDSLNAAMAATVALYEAARGASAADAHESVVAVVDITERSGEAQPPWPSASGAES